MTITGDDIIILAYLAGIIFYVCVLIIYIFFGDDV